MKLYICSRCHQHFMGTSCEHCHSPQKTSLSKMAGLTLILGLGLSACGEKEDDSAVEDTEEIEEPAAEPADGDLYGVPSAH